MKKIIQYCKNCEERFAERFNFCPNCSNQLTSTEIQQVLIESEKPTNQELISNNHLSNQLRTDRHLDIGNLKTDWSWKKFLIITVVATIIYYITLESYGLYHIFVDTFIMISLVVGLLSAGITILLSLYCSKKIFLLLFVFLGSVGFILDYLSHENIDKAAKKCHEKALMRSMLVDSECLKSARETSIHRYLPL